ncbi:MAG TPA: hypothetical protein VGE07_02570, partial [Herpetosiphonaceae bacterium]
ALIGGLLVILTGVIEVLVILTGVAEPPGAPLLRAARRLLPAGVGGFWLAGVVAALRRIQRSEKG